MNIVEKLIPKLQQLGPRCKDELLKMRSLKGKLTFSYETTSTMKEYKVDGDGNPLDADKCKTVLDNAKGEVREVMSLIVVAKMVLADARVKPSTKCCSPACPPPS